MGHIEQIKAAIEYIEANLTKKLDLDMVAAAVHYSKHHLQRTFSRHLGPTLHDYLQRRQLTEAAKLLVFSNQRSKGLEFDEIIIPDVDSDNYHTEYDRSLLYIACTRAMHRLTLLWVGERSPLLDDTMRQVQYAY